MGFSLAIISEAMMLASALSLDAFVAGFAYGSKRIKIPFKSARIINFICSAVTGLSLLAGAMLKRYIPGGLSVTVSFAVLLMLGIIKLLDSVTKSIIRKHNNLRREIRFSMLNFRFILNLYANPEEADVDGSKTLSPAEAVSLAAALSLDGIAVGLGAAIGGINGAAVFLCSLAVGMVAILSGSLAGNAIAGKSPLDLSWLSGIILIALACAKLV